MSKESDLNIVADMPDEKPITILIAEDQAIIRMGLMCALESFHDLKVVAESADGVAAVLDALAFKPQVILMDIGLPQLDGILAAKKIKAAVPGVRIIMFTTSNDDETIFAALAAGADGYCLKDVAPEHLHSAIKAVAKGVAWLDPGIADRVLRARHGQRDKVLPSAQQPGLSGSGNLTEDQMLILHLLSQGADLEYVAQKSNISVEAVANLINATMATLYGSAAAHQLQQPMSAVEGPQRSMLADIYSIDSVLGRGSMGIVYKGKHLLMDRLVAIKMLHAQYLQDELLVKRFQSEAKSLSGLSHPNLVAVFDFGMTPTAEPYMVMEYHDGKGLDDILESHSKIELGRAVNIFSQVCDALTEVHGHDMVHRDIKPGNIVISEDGQVKLVDFGIARSSESMAANLTMDGEIVGTPKYMSPEQCMGKELDARSDIYALGCVMYEVFAGQAPFEGGSCYEMLRQHVNAIPSRLSLVQPPADVSPVLEAIVFKTLEKEPDQRYQSAAQLKKDLQAYALSA